MKTTFGIQLVKLFGFVIGGILYVMLRTATIGAATVNRLPNIGRLYREFSADLNFRLSGALGVLDSMSESRRVVIVCRQEGNQALDMADY